MSRNEAMSKGLGLSVAAALASGFVYLSVLAGGAISILLTYLTPLPLVMVGLAFGLGPAALGAGLALGVVLVGAPAAVPVFTVAVLLPVLVLVRQSLLWRQTADGKREWYPP